MKNWKKVKPCICSEHQYVHILMYTVPKNNLNLYILYDQASTASSMTGHIFLYEDNTSLNFRCHQKIENTAFSLIYFPFFLSFSLPFLRKAPFFTHNFCFSGSVLGGGYIQCMISMARHGCLSVMDPGITNHNVSWLSQKTPESSSFLTHC